MKNILLTLFTTLVVWPSSAVPVSVVDIPDANFKTYLIGNSSINTNNDSQISLDEANSFTGTINVINKQIADFTGLETFVNITGLQCSYNNAPLNVTKNINLTDLRCYGNELSTLDLSKNTALDFLDCHSNDLTNLDFSNNPVLRSIDCKDNQLISLDLSQNPKLTYLNSSKNILTSLNLANGNNTKLTTLYTTTNPNLTCIEVDDEAESTLKWHQRKAKAANIDAIASFSEDCTATVGIFTKTPSQNNFMIYPNPVEDQLTIDFDLIEIQKINILDLTGKNIKTIIPTRTIDVNNLSEGIYILQLETKKNIAHSRFVKK